MPQVVQGDSLMEFALPNDFFKSDISVVKNVAAICRNSTVIELCDKVGRIKKPHDRRLLGSFKIYEKQHPIYHIILVRCLTKTLSFVFLIFCRKTGINKSDLMVSVLLS